MPRKRKAVLAKSVESSSPVLATEEVTVRPFRRDLPRDFLDLVWYKDRMKYLSSLELKACTKKVYDEFPEHQARLRLTYGLCNPLNMRGIDRARGPLLIKRPERPKNLNPARLGEALRVLKQHLSVVYKTPEALEMAMAKIQSDIEERVNTRLVRYYNSPSIYYPHAYEKMALDDGDDADCTISEWFGNLIAEAESGSPIGIYRQGKAAAGVADPSIEDLL